MRLLPATTVPEMQRSDLAGTVLQLKTLVGAGSMICSVPGFGRKKKSMHLSLANFSAAGLEVSCLVGGGRGLLCFAGWLNPAHCRRAAAALHLGASCCMGPVAAWGALMDTALLLAWIGKTP